MDRRTILCAFSIVPWTAIALTVPSTPAAAWSCKGSSSTLAEDHAAAEAIVIGQVGGGCPGDALPVRGRCPDERYHIDVLEVLKDSVPSRDFNGVYEGRELCEVILHPGRRYLLFITGDGTLDHGASGALKGKTARTWVMQEHVRILRDYRDGKIGDLSGPWRFVDTTVSCRIVHDVAARGTISFGFQYAENEQPLRGLEPSWDADGNVEYAQGPPLPDELRPEVRYEGPEPRVGEVWFHADFPAAGRTMQDAATVRVGGKAWALQTAQETMVIDEMDPVVRRYEIALGDTATEILEAMRTPADVVVRTRLAAAAGRSPPAGAGGERTFETRTTQIGEAAAKFIDCIAGGPSG